MIRPSLLTTALVVMALPASADDRTFNEIVWCSDGFDQKATLKTTDEGLELRVGDTVEVFDIDGGSTNYGGIIATSRKTKKDATVLPGELVYGHDMERKRRVVVVRDRVFMACDGGEQ